MSDKVTVMIGLVRLDHVLPIAANNILRVGDTYGFDLPTCSRKKECELICFS